MITITQFISNYTNYRILAQNLNSLPPKCKMQNSNQEIPKKAIKGYKLKGKSGIINLGNDKLKAKSLMSNKHLHQHHTLKTTYDK